MEALLLKNEPPRYVVKPYFNKIHEYKNSPDYKYILAFEVTEDNKLFFPVLKQTFKWVDGKPYEFETTLISYLIDTYNITVSGGMKDYWSARKLLGCSRSHIQALFKRTKKLWMKLNIVPIYELYPLIASGKHVNTRKVLRIGLNNLKKKVEIYKACKADKQDSISYLCAAIDMNPQEAKKSLGKGLWKDICKNSKTKNLLMGRYYLMYKCDIQVFEYLNKLPYSILKSQRLRDFMNYVGWEHTASLLSRWKEIIQYKRRMFKKNKQEWKERYGMDWPNREVASGGIVTVGYVYGDNYPGKYNSLVDVFYNLVNCIRDSVRCTDELYTRQHVINRFKNSKLEDFQAIHDGYIQEVNFRRDEIQKKRKERDEALYNSDFPFVHTLPHVVEYNGFKATLMLNAPELSEEGKHMSHCVAGYWRACHDKDSIIYKIEGPTKADRSTCEFYLNNVLRQNKHYCNQLVSESNKGFIVILQNSISHFMTEDARISKLNEELPNEYHRQIEQQPTEPNVSRDVVPCIIKRYIKKSGGEQT